ncbi:MAG TPA: hypothetical protein VF533_19295 [Solirubrobacteraceae bacterium]|jgi:hypothetical protein
MLRRPLLLLALVALLAAAAAGASAAATPGEHVGAAATKRITPSGVGAVKLGATYRKLRAAGLVGRLRRGCELAGPKQRFARLKAPLRGTADFTTSKPRRVKTITVAGGATARGVGVGDSEADIRAAFPKAKFDHGTDDTFGITVVRVPRSDGGRLQFALGTKSDEVELIALPRLAFCE